MAEELDMQLARLGLPERSVAVYVHLLAAGPTPAQELVEMVGLDQSDWDDVDHLVRIGLVSRSTDGAEVLSPVNPTASLDMLAGQQRSSIAAAKAAAAAAYDGFLRSRPSHYRHDLLEVVTGDAIYSTVREIEDSAREEVTCLDTPPYGVPAGPNSHELDNLERGVKYRVVYARKSIEDEEYWNKNVQPCISQGEQARVLASAPVKMMIVDRRVATVSLSAKEADVHHTMLVAQRSSLVSALIALFEMSWQTASPLRFADAPPIHLRPVEHRILQFLATGMTDDAIATVLGLSRRTVSRHLERIATLTGAVNRFQLAAKACREEWI